MAYVTAVSLDLRVVHEERPRAVQPFGRLGTLGGLSQRRAVGAPASTGVDARFGSVGVQSGSLYRLGFRLPLSQMATDMRSRYQQNNENQNTARQQAKLAPS